MNNSAKLNGSPRIYKTYGPVLLLYCTRPGNTRVVRVRGVNKTFDLSPAIQHNNIIISFYVIITTCTSSARIPPGELCRRTSGDNNFLGGACSARCTHASSRNNDIVIYYIKIGMRLDGRLKRTDILLQYYYVYLMNMYLNIIYMCRL